MAVSSKSSNSSHTVLDGATILITVLEKNGFSGVQTNLKGKPPMSIASVPVIFEVD